MRINFDLATFCTFKMSDNEKWHDCRSETDDEEYYSCYESVEELLGYDVEKLNLARKYIVVYSELFDILVNIRAGDLREYEYLQKANEADSRNSSMSCFHLHDYHDEREKNAEYINSVKRYALQFPREIVNTIGYLLSVYPEYVQNAPLVCDVSALRKQSRR